MRITLRRWMVLGACVVVNVTCRPLESGPGREAGINAERADGPGSGRDGDGGAAVGDGGVADGPVGRHCWRSRQLSTRPSRLRCSMCGEQLAVYVRLLM
jgi:hypothetical protein